MYPCCYLFILLCHLNLGLWEVIMRFMIIEVKLNFGIANFILRKKFHRQICGVLC